jgi:hypothetical protein
MDITASMELRLHVPLVNGLVQGVVLPPLLALLHVVVTGFTVWLELELCALKGHGWLQALALSPDHVNLVRRDMHALEVLKHNVGLVISPLLNQFHVLRVWREPSRVPEPGSVLPWQGITCPLIIRLLQMLPMCLVL